jgi:hypothetical protein
VAYVAVALRVTVVAERVRVAVSVSGKPGVALKVVDSTGVVVGVSGRVRVVVAVGVGTCGGVIVRLLVAVAVMLCV